MPFAVGTVRGTADFGFAPASVALFGLWIVGYLAFSATCLWLRSRRRARFALPMRVYAGMAAACGGALLVLEPWLWRWGLGFAPLLAAGLWAAAVRRERTVLAGGVLVAAASLMTVVAYRVTGSCPGECLPSSPTAIWVLAALLFAYFFGTVLYVKSMIRGRGIRAYAVASVLFHSACTLAWIPVAMHRGSAWWWTVGLFVLLTVRAQVMVGRTVTPRVLGMGEAVASAVVLVLGLTLR